MSDQKKSYWDDAEPIAITPVQAPFSKGYFFEICGDDVPLVLGDPYHCRDTFHENNDGMDWFAFAHEKGEGERVAAFIHRFEREMRHQKLTVCGPTKHPRIMWVRPAKFWWRFPLRRSLFTALLRAGLSYDPKEDNFDHVLTHAKYLKGTKAAVRWFLGGNTWAAGDSYNYTGWVEALGGVKSEKSLREWLVMKPIPEKKLMEFAYERLGVKDKEELERLYRRERAKPAKTTQEKAAEMVELAERSGL